MAYIITMQDIKKFEVLNQLINNQITDYQPSPCTQGLGQAASLLGITHVHVSRPKQKVLKFGMHSLLRVKTN